MSDHHPTLSPSSFPALLQCACFDGGLPSDDAERGTLQHEAVREILTRLIPANAVAQLTDSECENISWVVSQIHENFTPEQIAAARYETRVDVFDDSFQVVTFGTADMIFPGILIDMKYGNERDYSAQMKAYALGEMQRAGTRRIAVVILYGRLRKMETYELSYEECEATVQEVVARRADPNKQPRACDYCHWCSHAPTCPALVNIAVQIAEARGEAQPPELLAYHPSEVTDPAQMARLLVLSRQMAAFSKSVEFHAKAMLARGVEVPGWQVKSKKGKIKVIDVMQAYERLGLSPEAFIASCSLSVPKIASAYAKAKEMAVAPARKAVEKELNGLLSWGQPSNSLVKIGAPAENESNETEGEE